MSVTLPPPHDCEPDIKKIRFAERYKGEIFHIEKTIIGTELFDEFKNEAVRFEYHIGVLSPVPSMRKGETKEWYRERVGKITKVLSGELKDFCPDPKIQQVYFFNRAYSKSKRQHPLFYGACYMSDCDPFSGLDVNLSNRNKWTTAINAVFKDLVFWNRVHQCFNYDNFNFVHDLGNEFAEFIHYATHRDEGVRYTPLERETRDVFGMDWALHTLKKNISELGESVAKCKDPSLKNYMLKVLDSFYSHILEKEIVARCVTCNDWFAFADGKKYCSPKCLKSSANKRNYIRRKKKVALKTPH